MNAVNSHSASDWSAVTAVLAPSPYLYSAPSVDRIILGGQSLTIYWSPPAIAGLPPYASIRLTYPYDLNGTEQRVGTITVSASPYRLTGLDNGVTYSLQLSAHGAPVVVRDTTASPAPGTPAALADVPHAPILTVTPQAATGVSNPAPIALSWNATVNGTRYASHWEVSYTTLGAPLATVVQRDQPSYVLKEPSRTAYQFKVRAINDLGAGAWSVVASATARSFASAVRSLEVTPERGSVQLSWVAPVHIGHPRFCSYDLRWQTLPGGAWTTVKPSTTATSHTISGLTNFQPIAVLVSPLTCAAPGVAAAGRVTLVTMAQGAPPALTGLEVVTNEQGQLVLRWDPATQTVPTFDHQSYLSEAWQTNWIDVEYSNTGGTAPYLASLRLRAPASAGALVLTPLASGQRYRFHVRPVNHVEAGPWQEFIESYTPTSGIHQFQGLVVNLEYQFQVRAVSEAGRGPWSTILKIVPQPTTDP